MDWRDRIAVVTGAASGIGRATARELADRGVHVVAVDVDADGLAAATSADEGGGRLVTPLVADVSDRERVDEALATIAAGRLDFVVSCAASFIARGVDASRADWDQALGVNVRGVANVVQAALPRLRRSDAAAVVNVASISAHVAQPGRWTYNATKGAIVSMTRCMAMDLAPDRIRVNAVSPGWIWTPEVARAAGGDRARWEPVWGRYHLMERLGEPGEVASAIAFLLSTDASFITGTELMVDGGYSAMGPEGLGTTSTFASAATEAP